MVLFKRMTINDLKKIKDSLISNFDDFWNLTSFKAELENPNSFFLVAVENEEILAIGGFRKIFDNADIMNIVVRKDIRNKGLGSLLLEKLLVLAKKEKIVTISLEVNKNNIYAIKLYEKFNFKTINIRKKYYNNTDDALIMYLNI